MLTLKGVGQALVVCGIILGLDMAGMGGIPGVIGGGLAIFIMLLGLALIRLSKRIT
jgi:hypothetical protein